MEGVPRIRLMYRRPSRLGSQAWRSRSHQTRWPTLKLSSAAASVSSSVTSNPGPSSGRILSICSSTGYSGKSLRLSATESATAPT